MNGIYPSFNAPLPEYPNMLFLVYRWGLDRFVGENNYLFCETLNSYLGELFNYGLSFIPYAPVIFYKNDGTDLEFVHQLYPENEAWINDKQFRILRRKGLKNSGDYGVQLNALTLQSEYGGGLFADYQSFKGLDSKFIQYSDDLNGAAIFDKKLINGELFYRPLEFVDIEPRQVFIQRENLKAFEQRAGFFNHGLTPEQMAEYEPTEEQKEATKRRIGEHLKEINDKRKLSEEKFSKTCDIFTKFRNEGRKLTIAKEDTGKEIGICLSQVTNRLKKAVEKGLMSEKYLSRDFKPPQNTAKK